MLLGSVSANNFGVKPPFSGPAARGKRALSETESAYNKRVFMNPERAARRAKASTATVSRVLNNASAIKHDGARLGLRSIEGLKYHPNLHTRSLAGSNSSTLGVIVSTLENRFFFGIYKTLEADAHAKGLRSRNDEHGLSR